MDMGHTCKEPRLCQLPALPGRCNSRISRSGRPGYRRLPGRTRLGVAGAMQLGSDGSAPEECTRAQDTGLLLSRRHYREKLDPGIRMDALQKLARVDLHLPNVSGLSGPDVLHPFECDQISWCTWFPDKPLLLVLII